MKHHFADLLDRTDGYWTIIPNRERYAYGADEDILDKEAVKALTITRDDAHWKQVFECPNVEELTLQSPGKEQVEQIQKLKILKRLRVTFLRTADIQFIGNLPNLEEIVLEYVSGFSDLSPLQNLKYLRALHFENLRRVSDFNTLGNIPSLKYLSIDGTVDWNQPINNFNFLTKLPNIEVFLLRFVTTRSEFPAFLSVLDLKNLRKIKIGRATFTTNEYAFLEAALPGVEGCSWDLCWDYNGNFEFLGKRAGFVKKTSPQAEIRCREFVELYEKMKMQSEEIIRNYKQKN